MNNTPLLEWQTCQASEHDSWITSLPCLIDAKLLGGNLTDLFLVSYCPFCVSWMAQGSAPDQALASSAEGVGRGQSTSHQAAARLRVLTWPRHPSSRVF